VSSHKKAAKFADNTLHSNSDGPAFTLFSPAFNNMAPEDAGEPKRVQRSKDRDGKPETDTD
jgi:hypothetical protein